MADPLQASDWLSRLLTLLPVRGHLDLRCFYGAPWRIDQPAAQPGEIPYHIVVGGSAVLESPADGAPIRLVAGDILLFPQGSSHVLHDGSGLTAAPERKRATLNLTVSENEGTGDRLDMMCGRFALTPRHDRLVREYLPGRLVVKAAAHTASTARAGSAAQITALTTLMRSESAEESLGGRALLDALSTALFTMVLRYASESTDAPTGLLALAGNSRLAPALSALFHEPEHAWTLPELARLCNMSRATLVRQFQERLGRSPAELLLDIRMTVAANELKKPTAVTAAIAEAVGYRSDAAFQRVFKQRMGMTPAQWRRAMTAQAGT